MPEPMIHDDRFDGGVLRAGVVKVKSGSSSPGGGEEVVLAFLGLV